MILRTNGAIACSKSGSTGRGFLGETLGQFNQKLDMLVVAGPALPPKLLAGPIYKHIYKLIVHGDRMLRPFLCKGPFNTDTEYTLLLGAIEANGKLDHDPREAENNRIALLERPTRRRLHERYK